MRSDKIGEMNSGQSSFETNTALEYLLVDVLLLYPITRTFGFRSFTYHFVYLGSGSFWFWVY